MMSMDLHAALLYISHYEDLIDEDLDDGATMMMISVVTKEEDWSLGLGVA